jgi:hypothetical protein
MWQFCPFSPHHPQNHLRRNAHFSNSAKSRPHILQTSTQQIDFVVDNQKTVVVSVGQLDKLNFGILDVVFLQVGQELFIVAGVNCAMPCSVNTYGREGLYFSERRLSQIATTSSRSASVN